VNFDFPLIMFIAILVTGVIWGLDHAFGLPARRKKAEALEGSGGSAEAVEKLYREPVFVEYARAFFPVILIVFLLRSFLVEPFRIPSGSMLPGLLPGDFILVNKFAYGVRLPIINTKVINLGDIRRGDVVVFRYPRDPSINYIKRLVGLPGDKIVFKNRQLFVNDSEIALVPKGEFKFQETLGGISTYKRYLENLAGLEHDVIYTVTENDSENDDQVLEITVPAGQYFVMGDNRDRSNDSRYWGFVPDSNLVGEAFYIWFSWDMAAIEDWFPARIRWHRIGNSIN
jgi:signal peptidase I